MVSELEALKEKYIATDFPGRRPGTIRLSRHFVERWIRWLRATRAMQVNLDNLNDYSVKLWAHYSPKSARDAWTTLSRFLNWMHRVGITPYPLHKAIRVPITRTQRRNDSIPYETYLKLRSASEGHWMSWIILLGWNTGMSFSDCLALKWGDVDMENCCIRIKRLKTGTESLIPFDPLDELGRTLRDMRDSNPDADPDDYVSEQAGSALRPDSDHVGDLGHRTFRYIAAKAGLKGTRFHGLRHAFCSMLANNGMNTALATKVSGHLDPRVFTGYVHADLNAIRKAVTEAKMASGRTNEVHVESEVKVVQKSPSVWKPDHLYVVKRGRIKLHDGTPVEFVMSGSGAEGRRAVCKPCDCAGEPVADIQLVVDILDVRSSS
jgi:integrase